MSCNSTVKAATAKDTPDFYVGVDVAFKSLTMTKQLIDNVSAYTNCVVIGCSLEYNLTKLTEISRYAYAKGLHFIVYTDRLNYPSLQWLEYAKHMWGDKFMGIYAYDEPGGRMLDRLHFPSVTLASNYSDAADRYVHALNWMLCGDTNYSITNYFADPNEFTLFTSDYALYWYDYYAGYDTVLAQLGFNFSRQFTISLVRGAATCFDKDWGVIMCWTYQQPPFIESGPDLYNDLVYSYLSGAKYILVFDSNVDYSDSILKPEHYNALEQFWQYTQNHPREATDVSDRTANVLPVDYGCLFHGPEEKMWGIWNADKIAPFVHTRLNETLRQYGIDLDLVYTNCCRPLQSVGYKEIITWDGSVFVEAPFTLPSSSPTASPTNSPIEVTPVATVVGILLAVIALSQIIILRFKKSSNSDRGNQPLPGCYQN
jgi:hypothetical protein